MKTAILALLSLLSSPAGAVVAGWDSFGETDVIWAESEGLKAIRFENYGMASPERMCSDNGTHIVTVLTQQIVGSADDHIRGKGPDGRVVTYRIPLHDAPRVIESWIPSLLAEGNKLRVTSEICGSGGHQYLTQVERL